MAFTSQYVINAFEKTSVFSYDWEAICDKYDIAKSYSSSVSPISSLKSFDNSSSPFLPKLKSATETSVTASKLASHSNIQAMSSPSKLAFRTLSKTAISAVKEVPLLKSRVEECEARVALLEEELRRHQREGQAKTKRAARTSDRLTKGRILGSEDIELSRRQFETKRRKLNKGKGKATQGEEEDIEESSIQLLDHLAATQMLEEQEQEEEEV